MKDVLNRFVHMIRRNISLKVAAVIAAFLLWNYVITYVDMPRMKSVQNIPITFQFEAALNNRGMLVVNGDPSLLSDVRVDLMVKRSDYSNVDTRTVRVYADLSRVTRAGIQEVPLTVLTDYGTVESVTPGTIMVEIEQQMTRNIPITCTYTGTLGANLWLGRETISPATLEVTGAMTQVEQVASARVTVDITGLKSSFEQAVECELLDVNGVVIDKRPFIGIDDSVIVTVPIYPTKKVLIDTRDAYINLEPGYIIKEFTLVTGSTVTVAAEQAVLDRLSSVMINKVDLSGLMDASMQFPVSFIWEEPILAYEPLVHYVLVTVVEEPASRVFDQVPVSIIGMNAPQEDAPNYMPQRIRLEIAGPRSWVNALQLSDIECYVDVMGLESGTHELEVQTRLLDVDRSEFILVTPPTVTVTVP